MTVPQLSQLFGVTRNAILVHLQALEASGLVEREDSTPTGRVGKPAVVYTASSGVEDKNSKAYKPIAEQLAGMISDSLDLEFRDRLYAVTGHQLAKTMPVQNDSDLEALLTAAIAEANALGAAVDRQDEDDVVIIRSFTCPIASMVRKDPCACTIIKGFFNEATGRSVSVMCKRGEKLKCEFHISR